MNGNSEWTPVVVFGSLLGAACLLYIGSDHTDAAGFCLFMAFVALFTEW